MPVRNGRCRFKTGVRRWVVLLSSSRNASKSILTNGSYTESVTGSEFDSLEYQRVCSSSACFTTEFWDSTALSITRLYTFFFLDESALRTNSDRLELYLVAWPFLNLANIIILPFGCPINERIDRIRVVSVSRVNLCLTWFSTAWMLAWYMRVPPSLSFNSRSIFIWPPNCCFSYQIRIVWWNSNWFLSVLS